MRIFIVLIVGVLCLNLNALGYGGTPIKESWEKGQITLHSGQVIQGELQYNMKENVVILKVGEQMRAFSSHSVRSFTITHGAAPRKYFAVMFHLPSGKDEPQFFQIVFDGMFTLFVKEREVLKDALQGASLPFTRYCKEDESGVALKYYAYMPDGRFQQVSPNRHQLRRLFDLNDEGVKMLNRYILEQDIDFTRQPDIIRLIDHYVAQNGGNQLLVSD